MNTLVFAGDTHGSLDHLAEAPADAAVVHVGDMAPLGGPLEAALPPGLQDRFKWIPGNHEYDRPEFYRQAFTEQGAAMCFHLKVIEVAGHRVAGLGGIFSSNTWWPKSALPAGTGTKAERLRATPPQERFENGMPLKHRKFIYREDFDALERMQADVLVTHEAPSSHQHGFFALDELARRMGAHTIVHGHHHRDYATNLSCGIRVIGVGLRGLTDLQGRVLRPGEKRTRC